MSANHFTKRTLAFFEGIKRTEELFGRIQLIFISSGLINLILLFFNTMTVFFDPEVFKTWWSILTFFGYFGVFVNSIGISAYMPQMTYELEKRIQRLASKLDTMPDERENDVIVYLDDGTECHFERAKAHVLKKIQGFQGFSVLDFFTVRRSILTIILAHFMAYFIVLLQFRVSELSSN